MATYSDDPRCLAGGGGSVDILNVTEGRNGKDEGGAGGRSEWAVRDALGACAGPA